MNHVAIVGAGLSGRLLALNLLRQGTTSVKIFQIDRSKKDAMGPAYSDKAGYLLLNVPARIMGAYSDNAEHFLQWAQKRGIQANPVDFLPRRLYREYILEQVQEAQRASDASLESVCGEVTDIELQPERVMIRLSSGDSLDMDKAVLALGNFPPRNPQILNPKAFESSHYIQNPWDSSILDSLTGSETVFLIGTGQTTVDIVVGLHERGHQGRVVAISRRGLLPMAHGRFDEYPSFFEEIKDLSNVKDVFRVIRKHVARAGEIGIDQRSVIDSLRPHTQAIWQGFPEAEKRRFVRHLFRYWEIIRSRIPTRSQEVLDAMRSSGRLEVVAGHIQDIVEIPYGLEVSYIPRGQDTLQKEQASLVINCIGPEADYEKIDHPLVKNLLRRGLVRPGPARLGMDALPNGALLGRDGTPSRKLYTLGPAMKGVLWEVLATPDIKIQAEQLAHLLLEEPPD